MYGASTSEWQLVFDAIYSNVDSSTRPAHEYRRSRAIIPAEDIPSMLHIPKATIERVENPRPRKPPIAKPSPSLSTFVGGGPMRRRWR